MRKEEIFIRIEKNFKKIKRFIEINIYNNQDLLVLSINDYQKPIKSKSYISVCDNKISSYTLCNNRNLNVYTNDEMRYIGMNRLIKSEVLNCILQKKECRDSGEISKAKNIKGLGGINTTKISNTQMR